MSARCCPSTWIGILPVLALLLACSADPDGGIPGQPGYVGGYGGSVPSIGGSGGGGGSGCVDCGGFGGGAAGGGEPYVREVCYPGPSDDYTVCAPVVPWSDSWGAEYAYPSHSSAQYQAPLYFVDLSAVDPSLPVAHNFVLDEVMQESKGRYGVYQPHVVARLQQIRDQIGTALHINSAYRSPAYNASVGGVTYSRHMYGDAADMWASGVSVQQMGNICDSLGAGYVGLYASFTHCDWRNEPLEPAFYDAGEPVSAELPEHDGWLARLDGGHRWEAPASGFDEGEPLRIWTAFDGDGYVVDEAMGETYEPPAQATRLRVEVGGQLVFETTL